jgi:hypothetical protein
VKDNAGRLKVALTGAGRTNTQKLIDYIRERAGIPAPAPDSEAITEEAA